MTYLISLEIRKKRKEEGNEYMYGCREVEEGQQRNTHL